ncbi:MAG TPA: ammonium transporter, partial [Erythrobacter sp.]|nr:ammonium transporter [Erythrobacter sp.]
MTRKHLYTAPLALAGLLVSAPAFAQEAVLPEAAEAVSGGTAYILNTLLFLIGGFLV